MKKETATINHIKKGWIHPCIIASMTYLILALFFLTQAMITKHLDYMFSFIGYGGTFKYPSISLGSHTISLYYTAHLVGLAGMIALCLKRAGQFGVSRVVAVITAVLLAVFGYAGAKILYIIESFDKIIKNGLPSGGVSFFGTVFFMPFVIPLMALLFRKKPLEYLDYCTPSGILMLTCIRTGCFLRGCCRGITLWIMERPIILPAQLLECSMDMLLLYVILLAEAKGLGKGKLYFLFMGGYGLLRFFVEFIRDTPKDFLYLSHGQWFSIFSIMISLCALRILTRKKD